MIRLNHSAKRNLNIVPTLMIKTKLGKQDTHILCKQNFLHLLNLTHTHTRAHTHTHRVGKKVYYKEQRKGNIELQCVCACVCVEREREREREKAESRPMTISPPTHFNKGVTSFLGPIRQLASSNMDFSKKHNI